MSPPPEPPDFGEWESPESLVSDRPIRERLLDVLVQVRDPTTVAEIAERADCGTETARDYLEWFADAGIAREHGGRPVRYERNESYLRWRRIERIRDAYSDEEIVAELERTLDRLREYRETFDADHPDEVSLLAAADEPRDGAADGRSDDDGVGALWEDLSEWQTLERRAEYLDAARRDEFAGGRRSRIDA